MERNIQGKARSEKKQSTLSLTATTEATGLLSRIRRKYVRAELTLNPNDDQPISAGPGTGQILRAGLLLLDETMDISKPKEVMEVIDRAKRRTGPDTDPNSKAEDHRLEDQTQKLRRVKA